MAKSAEEKAADKAAKKASKETEVKSAEETTDTESTDDAGDDEEIDSQDDEKVLSVLVEYINPEIGLTQREFSHQVHGKNFKKLASQFAEKFNGTIL